MHFLEQNCRAAAELDDGCWCTIMDLSFAFIGVADAMKTEELREFYLSKRWHPGAL
jgi:hypothetical protein